MKKLFVGLIVGVVISGTAWASIPSTDGTIDACYAQTIVVALDITLAV